MQFAIKVLACVSSWWLASVCVTFSIKSTVSPGGVYPHAFAFTSMTQPTVALFAWLLAGTVFSTKEPLPPLLRKEMLILLVYGLMQGLEIALTNKALQSLTVSERTILGSTSILFMMVTAWAWGLEGFGIWKVMSCALLVCGSALQGVGATNGVYLGLDDLASQQGDLHPLGVFLQLASTIISTQRWALLQYILQRSPPESTLGKMSKLQLLARVMPITGIVCIPLAMIFEEGAYSIQSLSQVDLLTQVFLVSFCLVFMLVAELQLVMLVSAVAYQVLATIHQIPTVLCGVLFRHDRVGVLDTCGFGCCIAGALVYAKARQLEGHVRRSKDLQEPLVIDAEGSDSSLRTKPVV